MAQIHSFPKQLNGPHKGMPEECRQILLDYGYAPEVVERAMVEFGGIYEKWFNTLTYSFNLDTDGFDGITPQQVAKIEAACRKCVGGFVGLFERTHLGIMTVVLFLCARAAAGEVGDQ